MSLGRSGEGIITPATSTVGWFGKGPDTLPTSPNVADDEFDGAAIDTAGTRASGATAWTALNLSTSTVQHGQSALMIRPVGVSGDHLRGYEQVLPAGAWKYRAKVLLHAFANSYEAGIAVRRTANGKLESWTVARSGTGTFLLRHYTWTDENTFSAETATAVTIEGVHTKGQPVYLEVEYDLTSLLYRYSFTGLENTFVLAFTRLPATHLGGVPDRIAVVAETSSATNPASSFMAWDWFRRAA